MYAKLSGDEPIITRLLKLLYHTSITHKVGDGKGNI